MFRRITARPLFKQPGESLLFSMDFSHILESGETISGVTGVTSNPVGTITISAPTSSPSIVQFRISGGVDGEDYQIQVEITTNFANTRNGDGILRIRES